MVFADETYPIVRLHEWFSEMHEAGVDIETVIRALQVVLNSLGSVIGEKRGNRAELRVIDGGQSDP